VKNSVPFVQLGSLRASGAEGGVKYVARSGSSVTFNLRSLVVQLVVVMLACVDDLAAQTVAVAAQHAHQRSDLHEVGPGAGDW
jgi:hypothetical protein